MKTERGKLRTLSAVLASAAILLAAPVLAADPPAAPEPVELKTLRMEYQQRLMKAQTPADDWYRMQLRTLLARYKQTGNLNAAVTAQSEMENPDPSKPVPADKPLPPDLAGIRNTYIVNAQRLTQPVEGWYRQQLGALERSLVQKGDLAGAQAVRSAMGVEIVTPPLSAHGGVSPDVEWKTPWGGKLTGNSKEGDLEGPGKGFGNLVMAMAFTERKIKGDFRVKGKIRVSGICGGLMVGRDESSCANLYWCKGASVVVWHDGATRKMVSQPPLPWKPGRWQEFELHRVKDMVEVRLDGKPGTFALPPGTGHSRFGFMIASPTSRTEFKDLVIAEEGSAAGS